MTRGENGTGAGVDNMSKLDFFSIDWYSQWFDDGCHDWKLEEENFLQFLKVAMWINEVNAENLNGKNYI